MKTEITIKKGEQSNKLKLIRDISNGLDDLFHTIETSDKSLFGPNKKIVAKKSFKATLIVEELSSKIKPATKKTITVQLEVEKIREDGEFTKVLYGGHTCINVKNHEVIG